MLYMKKRNVKLKDPYADYNTADNYSRNRESIFH